MVATTFEFRKRRLAPDVDTVLIYESSPTPAHRGPVHDRPHDRGHSDEMWARCGAVGSIDRDHFMRYYAEHTRAFGLVVGTTERLERPVALADLSPTPAVPQSFRYLPPSVSGQIAALQPIRVPFSLLGMVVDLLQRPARATADAATH